MDVLDPFPKIVQGTQDGLRNLETEYRNVQLDRWLRSPEPSVNFNKALRQCQEGTGLWFLESQAFADWKAHPNSFLWLRGIPGSGKTVLSATILENLQHSASDHHPLLYFFCDFNDTSKQTLENIVRSLIRQLYYQHEATRAPLDSLFSSYDAMSIQASCRELCSMFVEMIGHVSEVWILLDAVDECTTRKGSWTEGILSWIEYMRHPEQGNVHILITSRPEQDIQAKVGEWASSKNILPLGSDVIDGDIREYVRARVRNDDGLKRWRKQPKTQEKIETALMEKANGMFRWAACQLDTLENCLDPRSLDNVLRSLPKTLDETYDRMLGGIPEEYYQNALRILQLLTFSPRPLRLEEVTDAIAVDPNHKPYFDPGNRMPDPCEISRYCSNLVVIVPRPADPLDNWDRSEKDGKSEDLVIQLAHFSVKEYLTSNRIGERFANNFEEATAKTSIAKICVAYLLSLGEDISAHELRETFPFAGYSARYWLHHAGVRREEDGAVHRLIMEFFLNNKTSYRNWRQLYDPDHPFDEEVRNETSPPSPLYCAALGGLLMEVQALIMSGADVNAQGGYYGTALQAASHSGHERVVEILLAKGADIIARGEYSYVNALHAALHGGNERVVEMLLDKGANVDTQCGVYGNSLKVASGGGHKRIVEMLLAKGADKNPQSYGSALQAASYGGHEQVVEILLAKGADINAQSEDGYGSALQAASEGGHKGVVEILLAKGADINAEGKYGYPSALQAALNRRHKGVVEILLDKGAKINDPGGYYGIALKTASIPGNEKIVEMLLAKAANINAEGGEYDNALQDASAMGNERVVEILLAKGANANAQSAHGNALRYASYGGHENIVEILLAKGADVNAQGGSHGDALQAASYGGHGRIVELLLAKGANINAQGGTHGNALQAASDRGHKEVVEILLAKGANINARGGYSGNALQAASYRGHEKVVEILLAKGANVNAPGEFYGNALQAAIHSGHERVVEILLAKGADVNAQGGFYGNALQAASYGGHGRIVELLLAKGANINAQGGSHGNALRAASDRGHKRIVEILLARGADMNVK